MAPQPPPVEVLHQCNVTFQLKRNPKKLKKPRKKIEAVIAVTVQFLIEIRISEFLCFAFSNYEKHKKITTELYFLEIKKKLEILWAPAEYWPQDIKILKPTLDKINELKTTFSILRYKYKISKSDNAEFGILKKII